MYLTELKSLDNCETDAKNEPDVVDPFGCFTSAKDTMWQFDQDYAKVAGNSHLKKLRYFFRNAILGCASVILNHSEVMTKAPEYLDLGMMYLYASKAEVQNFMAFVPADKDQDIVEVFSVYDGNIGIIDRVSPFHLLSPELQEKFKNKKQEVVRWYLYLVNCMTPFGQSFTRFINIDDNDKLQEALQSYEDDALDLPMHEFSYLLIDKYYQKLKNQYKVTHYYSDMVLGFDTQREWETKSGQKMKGREYVIQDRIIYSEPSVKYPEVDMDGIERRLYHLFIKLMKTCTYVGADTETTGLDVFYSKLVSLGLTFDAKLGFYLSFDHTPTKEISSSVGEKGMITYLAGLDRQYPIKNSIRYIKYHGKNSMNLDKAWLNYVVDWLMVSKSIWHNAKYDWNIVLSNTGKRLPIFMDTMLAHYVARPGYDVPARDKRGLKIIAPKELGIESWKIDITKCQDEEKDIVAAYNARDTCYMFAVALKLAGDLYSNWGLFQVEMNYLPCLMEAERTGIGIDTHKLADIEKNLREKADKVKTEFSSMFSPEENFNINSGPMLKELFYNKWGIIPPRKCMKCGTRHQEPHHRCVNEKCENFTNEEGAPTEFVTDKGDPKLDKYVLSALAQAGEEKAKDLMEYRAATKLITSYCNLPEKVHDYDHMLHPQYVQNGTATGRISSKNPNFQQLPKKAGKYIRGCIIGKPKTCLISADYAGQEIRILAAYTRDETLMRAYNPCYKCEHNPDKVGWFSKLGNCPFENHDEGSECNTVDIHSYITKQVYADKIDVPIEQIKNVPEFNKMRSICKSVTFGLAYGGTEYGLSRSTGIPLDEAREVMEKYFATFKSIKKYIHDCQLYVDQHGEIMDMVGRRRRFEFAGWEDATKRDAYYEDWSFSDGLRGLKKEWGKMVRADRRAATNFPIQGLAASMTKIAAANIYNRFLNENVPAQIVQFIHDEVLVMCRKDPEVIKQTIDIIRDCMVNKIDMPSHCLPDHKLGWSWPAHLPMNVEAEVGDSYGDIMEPEEYLEKIEQVKNALDNEEAVETQSSEEKSVELTDAEDVL